MPSISVVRSKARQRGEHAAACGCHPSELDFLAAMPFVRSPTENVFKVFGADFRIERQDKGLRANG